MKQGERWLLPDGVDELLPPEAIRFERLRRQCLDHFHHWGYDLVAPPLIEYLESLLTGSANDLNLQTFKLTDQLSGRLMGVRADITPQVARIDAHRLGGDGVARLCYCGEVLRAIPHGMAGQRGLTQLGAELYGHSGLTSDFEIISLALETLLAAGCEDLCLDLGHVGIFRSLLAGLPDIADLENTLSDILVRKATPELLQLIETEAALAPWSDLLAALPSWCGDASLFARLEPWRDRMPAESLRAIEALQQLGDMLRSRFPEVGFFFDLAELRGYHYHSGVLFSVYATGRLQPLAQGGRYDDIGLVFGAARPATGFSLDLEQLVRHLQSPVQPESLILAPLEGNAELHQTVRRLRQSGRRVVHALPGADVQQMCGMQLVWTGTEWLVEPISGTQGAVL